jgi:glycosyltransferase involved in cell wall biosynthesis
VYEKKKGPAAARNAGIAVSRGEFLAFIDADCYAQADWLREGLAGFDKEHVGCVLGRVFASNPANMYERIIAERDEFNVPDDYHGQSPYAITANVFFRRAVFDAIGPFDTTFRAPAGEDVDICWRMHKETPYVLERRPRAVVYHKHRSGLKAYFRQYFNYGLYHQVLRRKFPEEFTRAPRSLTLGDLVSIMKQTLCIPKVFVTTRKNHDKEYTRALHLMNLARQSAFYFGKALGKIKLLSS